MPGSCFTRGGEIREDTKIAISPNRCISFPRNVCADSYWTGECFEVEVVPESIREEFSGQSKLGAEQAGFVVVVSDQQGEGSGCCGSVVGEDDGLVYSWAKKT